MCTAENDDGSKRQDRDRAAAGRLGRPDETVQAAVGQQKANNFAGKERFSDDDDHAESGSRTAKGAGDRLEALPA
jgi:hypothetical protein